jgi:photosystem II stability/assembly factor-like uncharacterized protein
MKKLTLLIYCLLSILSDNIYSQFTWQQLNGPQGGVVSEIKSNSSGVLFMGSIGGGVLRSTDNGLTWIQKVNGFPGPVFDDGTVALAVANDGDIFASSFTDGVFRSTNSGETWINTNFPNAFIVTIIIDQNKRIYAGTPGGGGVFVSTNNGLNWVQKNNGLPVPAQISALCLTASGELFAGIATGNNSTIFRSTNNAESWQPTNLTNANSDHIVSYGSIVYAAAYNLGIYRSTNSGQNWLLINNGLTNHKINRLFAGTSGLYAATDSGVFRSTNNGDNWFKIGLDSKKITEIYNTANGVTIAAVFVEGIFRTTNNGTNWISSSAGFNCNAIISVSVSGNNFFAGTAYNGLMRSSDNGNTWLKLSGGFKGSSCELVYTAPGNYILAQSDSGLFRSTNNGNSWLQIMSGFISFNNIVNNQSGTLYASGSYPSFGVWKSTSSGLNWEVTDPNFTASVYSLCITPNGYLFAGTAGGGVYRSFNSGSTWTQTQPYASVISLTAGPNGYIYGCFNSVSGGQNGIYRSTDYGLNWQFMGLANTDYFFLKSNSAGHIFAGGFYGSGILRSTNSGMNWYEINSGIFNRMIATLFFDNSGFGYAGTYYGGLYKTNISTIGLINISTEIPDEFSLSQNYPNPFNPATKISFSLPKASFVKMVVFDITGKEVETLVNENLTAGSFEIDFDALKLTSGVYFYRITTDGFADTKKMVLVK